MGVDAAWVLLSSGLWALLELWALGCKTSLLWAITSQVVTLVWLFLRTGVVENMIPREEFGIKMCMHTYMHTYIQMYTCLCVCLALRSVHVELRTCRGLFCREQTLEVIWHLFLAFFQWSEWRNQAVQFCSPSRAAVLKASWTGTALTHAGFQSEDARDWGGSRQTGLPSHDLDLPSTGFN